jgi:uncharacterized protein (DUF433 family)
MATIQKSLRIGAETAREIEQLGVQIGLDFSGTANQLLDEAIRMRRCPGIAFTSGPSGRRATVAGTGIDVWEIIATYKSVGGDATRLQRTYDWLKEPQLRAALAYYALYPDEVDARLTQEDRWTPEALAARSPAVAVAHRPRKTRRRR